MKKIIFALVLVLILITATTYALINSPTVTALNASTYTAISINKTNGKCRWVSAHTEDASSFLIATDSAGTDEEIIPANWSYKNPCVTDTSGVIFYAKSASGTPNLVINYGVNP